MAATAFRCPGCQAELQVEPGTTEVTSNCPTCGTFIESYLFPAFFRSVTGGAPAAALLDQTEASCFYHPQKQAVQVCDGCGRLLCSLCSVEMGAEHLCPNCIAAGRKKGRITMLEDRRTRYDSIALSLAVFSFLFYIAAIVLAPAALYISIRHWNSPGSLLGRSRSRFVLAIVLACLALVFWVFMISILIFHPHARHVRPR